MPEETAVPEELKDLIAILRSGLESYIQALNEEMQKGGEVDATGEPLINAYFNAIGAASATLNKGIMVLTAPELQFLALLRKYKSELKPGEKLMLSKAVAENKPGLVGVDGKPLTEKTAGNLIIPGKK